MRTGGVILFGALLLSGLAEAKSITNVALSAENVEFKAKSNISAIEIVGKTNSASGAVQVSETGAGLEVMNLKLQIPVNSINSGIAIRDRHMREKIFTTQEGDVPDISFESSKVDCPSAAAEVTCSVAGRMSIRGVQHEMTLPVRLMKYDGGYHVSAGFSVGLRDFGIEPPTHFGVGIDNQVEIQASFNAKNVGVIERPEPKMGTLVAKKVEPAKQIREPASVMQAPEVPAPPASPSMAPAENTEVHAVAKGGGESESGNRLIEVRLADGTVVKNLSFSETMSILKMKGKLTVSVMPATPSAPSTPLRPSKSQHQVASYRSEKSAQKQSEDLKLKGLSAHVEAATVNGSTWYRVFVEDSRVADAS